MIQIPSRGVGIPPLAYSRYPPNHARGATAKTAEAGAAAAIGALHLLGSSTLYAKLRNDLLTFGLQERLDRWLVAAIANQSEAPLFSHGEANRIREITVNFVASQGFAVNLAVEAGQPFRLGLMEDPGTLAGDSDVDIGRQAREKVLTGVMNPIGYSGVFR